MKISLIFKKLLTKCRLNIHEKIITLQEDLIKYGLAENGQKIYIIAK